LAFYKVALKPLDIKFFLPYKGKASEEHRMFLPLDESLLSPLVLE